MNNEPRAVSTSRINTGDMNQLQRPTHMTDYAEASLQALSAGALGEQFSLGGAFGLFPVAVTLLGIADALVP